jgi:hypothetical protein
MSTPIRASDRDLRSEDGLASEDLDPAVAKHFWACQLDSRSCSYPERTGDLRSVVTIARPCRSEALEGVSRPVGRVQSPPFP